MVHTDELTARDRAAAILVIVFGQHIEDVIQLTWNDVTVTDDVVTVRLGKTEFALPSPLDEPMRQLAAAPGNDLTASHPNSNWVFRGYSLPVGTSTGPACGAGSRRSSALERLGSGPCTS